MGVRRSDARAPPRGLPLSNRTSSPARGHGSRHALPAQRRGLRAHHGARRSDASTICRRTTSAAPLSARQSRWPLAMGWVGLTVVLILTVPDLPWQRAVDHAKRVHAGWLTTAVAANLFILP